MSTFSEESKRVATHFFSRFDTNGDGTIQKRELSEALCAFGCDLDQHGLQFTTQQFDTDGDGAIQIHELVDNLDVLIKYSVDGDKLENAFKQLDINGDGQISYTELLKVLTIPGPNYMTKDEASKLINEMFAQYDTNNDRKLSYMEFVRLLIGQNECTPPKQIDSLVYNPCQE